MLRSHTSPQVHTRWFSLITYFQITAPSIQGLYKEVPSLLNDAIALNPFTSTLMSTDRTTRTTIALDTLDRTEGIIAEHASQGATADSIFYPKQIEPLERTQCPRYPPTPVQVLNSDSFALARQIAAEEIKDGNEPKVAVLNLASDLMPAGPWLNDMTATQEEALCYTSTLYATLKPEYYPWPNLGEGSVAGIFSPGVVIFKDELDKQCKDLSVEARQLVSVITVAAARSPELTPDERDFLYDSDIEDMKGKIRLIYRMAARHGQTCLVLGAMGCGAYGCPNEAVAALMRNILLEREFNCWFRRVVFACYSRSTYEQHPTNFDVFQATFNSVIINT